MHIVVNTPGSNIGRPLVASLLAAGEKVTVISRNPGSIAELVEKGAHVVEGSIDDAATLDRAFAGADAVFWLTPPQIRPDFREWAVATGRAAAEAARRQGVRRAVVLSSVGAQTGPGSGPVGVLLAIESAFRESLPDVVALRAGYFMENALRSLQTIATQGAIYSPVPADKQAPTVATRDIAAVAAEELRGSASGHRIRGVHGPVDLSGREQAQILSEALGRPVQYVEVPVAAARAGMIAAGFPEFAADLFCEMYQAVIDGRMDSSEPRSQETTTPTDFATFAREVVRPAVEAASPAKREFMAAFTIKGEPGEIVPLVPAEIERVKQLTAEGTFVRVHLAADRTRGFIEISARDEGAAREAMSSLPLAKFMQVELVALAPA